MTSVLRMAKEICDCVLANCPSFVEVGPCFSIELGTPLLHFIDSFVVLTVSVCVIMLSEFILCSSRILGHFSLESRTPSTTFKYTNIFFYPTFASDFCMTHGNISV